MNELIEKLTSYNIFNNLLPGALFAIFTEKITSYKIIQSDVIIALFLYYFIGMVISRLGSLLVERLSKATRFVTFAEYKDYVAASAKDDRLITLSEVNNAYRTMCALFISLIVVKLYEIASTRWGISQTTTAHILIVFLLVLFACSFRKQTNYIVARVKAGKHDHC